MSRRLRNLPFLLLRAARVIAPQFFARPGRHAVYRRIARTP